MKRLLIAMKRLLIALCAGVVTASVPGLMASLPARSGLTPAVQEKTNCLLTPGALAGVLITGGRVHDISFPLLFAVNALFYAVAVYLALAFAGRLFSRKPSPVPGQMT
jgi:hypothetical protein